MKINKAKMLQLRNVSVEIIWNIVTARNLENFFNALGVEPNSDKEPYDSKRAYSRDVISKINDEKFLDFCSDLSDFLQQPINGIADEGKLLNDRKNFEILFDELKDGYPKEPKINQIFFASTSKPDFTLDPLKGVLTDRKKCSLVFDSLYKNTGITNKILKHWFEKSSLAQHYSSLMERLNEAIDPDAEKFFFEGYYACYKGPEDITLLPQVWMNWDPLVGWQRNKSVVPTQRIDFLWCGPNDNFIVIEIDGYSHLDEKKYVEQIEGDRELLLRGFKTIRFSNREIFSWKKNNSLESELTKVFDRLIEMSK